MVYFVGAGSGAVDLITVRGQRLLRQADVVIYAGSLVNPQLLKETRPDCRLYNSAKMTLEEVLEVIEQAHREQACIVRLHTGDPCLYGAIREQMDQLDALNIPYEYVPGVSSFCAAAAALNAEYTPAGRFPDGHHHPHGRQNAGAGKGRDCKVGSPSGDYGHLFEHRSAGGFAAATDGGRLSLPTHRLPLSTKPAGRMKKPSAALFPPRHRLPRRTTSPKPH